MAIIGNSSRYSVTFDLSSTGCLPTTYTYNTTKLDFTSQAGYTNYIKGLTQSDWDGYNYFLKPSVPLTQVSGFVGNVPVTINTLNAGGTGTVPTSGWNYTMNIPVELDNLGNPILLVEPGSVFINNGSVSTLTTILSGIAYYTQVAVTVQQYSFQITNFYNTALISDLIYAEFTGGASQNIAANTDLVYTTSPRTAPYITYGPLIGNPPQGTASSTYYYNRVASSIAVRNTSPIFVKIRNNVGKTVQQQLFSPVAYIGLTPIDEISITGGLVSGMSAALRVSIVNSAVNPSTPNTSTETQQFNSVTLTGFDVQYLALGPGAGRLYTTGQFATLASLYPNLPGGSLAYPTSPNGNKYLTIKITNTSLTNKVFAINLGSDAQSGATVNNMWVQWRDTSAPGLGPTSWWNASIDYNLAGGCKAQASQNSNTKWFFQLNSAQQSSYTNPDFIFVNIQYTGYIKLQQIVLSAN